MPVKSLRFMVGESGMASSPHVTMRPMGSVVSQVAVYSRSPTEPVGIVTVMVFPSSPVPVQPVNS